MKQYFRSTCLSIFVLSLAIQTKPYEQEKICKLPADLIFVLDMSSSVTWQNFKAHVKTFVEDTILNFDIGSGPKDTRVGVVVFSSRAHLKFYLNQYNNSVDLINAVRDITFRGGHTQTFRALRFVANEMLTQKRGSREGVGKLVIVISDGRSDNMTRTVQIADVLKAKGAEIFAIGVGNKISFRELKEIASDPDSQFALPVSSFSALNSIEEKFINSTCEALGRTSGPSTITADAAINTSSSAASTTTEAGTFFRDFVETSAPSTITADAAIHTSSSAASTTTEAGIFFRGCRRKPYNVLFMYDSYKLASAIHAVFNYLISPFLKDVSITDSDTKIGIITQPCLMGYTPIQTAADVTIALKEMTTRLKSAEFNKLVKRFRLELFPDLAACGERQNIVVLVIDENTNNIEELTCEARMMKEANNTDIVVVAVGNVPVQVIECLASQPVQNYVIRVKDYENLKENYVDLLGKVCESKEKK